MTNQGNIDFFEFNNSLFSLIREISHKIDLLLQETSQDLDITTLQLKMIITISANKEPVSIGSLGKLIGVTGGNISNICKKLEKQGFVNRNRSEEDERVVKVSLTEKGQEAARRVGDYLDKLQENIPVEKVEINLQSIIEELNELNGLLDTYLDGSLN